MATCAVLGGPVGVAQASDNTLRATLNTYAPIIVKDERAVKHGLSVYPQGHPWVLTRALKHEVFDLHTLQFKLLQETPSTVAGATAKAEIVTGLGLIAKAYKAFRHDILVVHGGAVSPTAVAAAVRTRNNGHGKLVAGLKLLSTA
jgi:hypothetical protein